jgi:hypothetical protein
MRALRELLDKSDEKDRFTLETLLRAVEAGTTPPPPVAPVHDSLRSAFWCCMRHMCIQNGDAC